MKETNITQKKQTITKWTKYLLDFMFYSGILVTVSLPFSLKVIMKYLPEIGKHYADHYEEAVIIYFVLGVSAARHRSASCRRLCNARCSSRSARVFVTENVVSLRKMGNWSFFIAGMSMVRNIVWMTIAMLVVVLVFVIAGLFSKVLALVFEEAVRFKEENDLTI